MCRAVEQILKQHGPDAGAAGVGGNEQVRQHRDRIDIDDTSEGDDSALQLGHEQSRRL